MGIRARLPRWLACRCARLSRDDGSSAIELALLAPALIVITMLVIQWALWFQARQVALDAAQAGARVAREQEPGWPAQSVSEAEKFYNEVGSKVVTGLTASVSPDGGAVSLPMISHLVASGSALRQADPFGQIGQSGSCEVDVACMSSTLKQQASSAVNAVARMVLTDNHATATRDGPMAARVSPPRDRSTPTRFSNGARAVQMPLSQSISVP